MSGLAPATTTDATSAAADNADQGRRPFPRPTRIARTAIMPVQNAGPVPNPDIAMNAPMPVSEPRMSIEYARSGGIERRSGPSGRASAAITAAVSVTTAASTKIFASAAPASDCGPTKMSLGGAEAHVELCDRDQLHDREEQDRERREAQALPAPPEHDPEADPQEAGEQEEVVEEPDVGHVRRYPAQQEQLDEQERRAREKQADGRTPQLPRQVRNPRMRGAPLLKTQASNAAG